MLHSAYCILAFRRFIILEADAAVTPWSRICISHADCVLLVGADEASPQVLSPHHRTAGDGSLPTCGGSAGVLLPLSSTSR